MNKFTSFKDFYGEVGGPILRDRLWFYASHRDAESGNFIPGFIRLADREQVEFYTKLQDPTGKVTYQVTQNNKVEGMFQVGRKWQPYRTASRLCRSNRRRTRTRGRSSVRRSSGCRSSASARRSTPACSAAVTGGRTFRGRRTSARPTSRRTTARRAARSSRAIARRGGGSTARPTPTSRRCGARTTS